MASVLPQQPQSISGATDRLLESFTLAEQGGHAFLAEDGPAGSIVYTTVFLQDEEGDEVEIEDHQMLQRLQAALNNAASSATTSGATTATASSSASSDSGAAADGDEKDAWKVAVMEGIEDLLQLGGNAHDSSHASGHHSRRFSFDLTNIDMAALEQLACVGAASSPGPSSRRGSISLSFLEAEGIVVPKLLTTSTAAASPSSAVTSSSSAAVPAAATTTAGLVAVKPEPAAEEKDASRCRSPSTAALAPDTASSSGSSSSASTSGGSSCSGSSTSSGSTKRKAPSPTAASGGAAANKASVKRKLSGAAAVKQDATKEQKEEAPGSPALASTAAAMMLPCTPEHKIVDKTSPTAAKGASAATTAAMAALAASAAASSASSPNQGGGGPSYALPALPDDGLKRVGIYTVEERKARVARFQAKRSQRVWKKAVKYACRKNLADNRPRVKGRFVKREEEIDILVGSAMAASSAAQGSLLDQLIGLDDLLAE